MDDEGTKDVKATAPTAEIPAASVPPAAGPPALPAVRPAKSHNWMLYALISVTVVAMLLLLSTVALSVTLAHNSKDGRRIEVGGLRMQQGGPMMKGDNFEQRPRNRPVPQNQDGTDQQQQQPPRQRLQQQQPAPVPDGSTDTQPVPAPSE